MFSFFLSKLYLCLDKDGNSPLYWAASNGHFNIVKYLGDKGANLNLQSMVPFPTYWLTLLNSMHLDKDDNGPLCWAASKGHFDIVKYLGNKGADLNLQGMFLLSTFFPLPKLCLFR